MDINELRNELIAINQLVNTTDKYTFFYDETNNIRKLYIDNQSVNTEPCIFALGGIVCKSKNPVFNKQDLRTILHIQPSTNEIKRKHLVKGNFEEIICSSRINLFLQWMLDNNLLIHYSIIDTLYWSVIDIIDSIIDPQNSLFQYSNTLKANLLVIVKENLSHITSIFDKYRYPAIDPKDKDSFLNELITTVEDSVLLEDFQKMMLKGILELGKKLSSLPFVEGHKREELINNFSCFYFQQLILFENSTHIFDEEPSIQEIFNSNDFCLTNLKKRTYLFQNSKNEFGIQISDVIIGLIGKMFSYLNTSSNKDINQLKNKLSQLNCSNLSLLRQLIINSEKTNKAFLHTLISTDDIDKLSILLS